MTRLLVIGVGPRPAPQLRQVFAPGLRLDSMARVLASHGHEVSVGEMIFGGAEPPGPSQLAPHHFTKHDYIPPAGPEAATHVASMAAAHRAEAIVALTDAGALAAVQSNYEGPILADYFGHPMAERQMQAHVHGSNQSLASQWWHVLPVLLRADAFGVCSRAQKWALTGELGAAGRLNAETCGTELVHVLRPALPFTEPFDTPGRPLLRGVRVNAGARILLFSGGYNTWLDEELLFQAVEIVLQRDPQAVFVSTGGAIEGHVNRVFDRFRSLADGSQNRDRYHFLGWVEHHEFVAVSIEADAGISCDRWTLEGVFGCRNRLFGWLWAGMRAVASDPSELTAELVAAGLVEVPSVPKNAESLAESALHALELGRPDSAEAQRRRQVLCNRWSPEAAYAALLDWSSNPRRAPDSAIGNPLIMAQRRSGAAEALRADLRTLAARLSGSRAMGIYTALNPDVKELIERIQREVEE